MILSYHKDILSDNNYKSPKPAYISLHKQETHDQNTPCPSKNPNKKQNMNNRRKRYQIERKKKDVMILSNHQDI